MGKYAGLDSTLGIRGKAAKFLAAIDDCIFGTGSQMPQFNGEEIAAKIIDGLKWRLLSEAGRAPAEGFAVRHNAGHRLKRGKSEDNQIHDPEKVKRAIERFQQRVANGEQKQIAEKRVREEFGIAPRSLRRHIRKLLATH